ncbi:MAG: LysR family transcriptional regulator [Proteobacteria bacterium]|nr:LysR family transcriptional regulator [Pseudomonadota bacterium]
MDRFAAMSVFARVVELGSFARAADRLELSTSAVSRHVADLESHLHTRLLNRTTRKLSLTEGGHAFYERCVQVLADLEEAEQAAARTSLVPRGTLKLTCGQSFGLLHLVPAMAEYLARNPEVKFDVSLSDRVVDLVEEGFDLGVRIGALGPANLIARKLGETRLMACASRAYLEKHGTPQVPGDLVNHNCVTYAYVPDSNLWRFRGPDGAERTVTVSGNLHANNGDLLTQAAVNGIGIVYEPDFIVGPALAARQVVRLLEGWEPAPLGIYAVYASRKHLSAKVRSFVDFLAERFVT